MRTHNWIVPLLASVAIAFTAAAQITPASQSKPAPHIPGLDTRFIDTHASPCVDFDAYACGNFDKLYPIPPDQSSYGNFEIVYENTEQQLQDLLQKVSADTPTRTSNEQKIGDYYASCMDPDAIHAAGLKHLQPDLDRIAAITDRKQLTPLLARFQLTNINAFFGYGEEQDFKDARKQNAVVDQGGLGLPERDYYFRTGAAAEKTRQEYVQHITNMLHLLGETDAQAASDAHNIMQLETALAKVSMDVTARRNPANVYHPMSPAQLAALIPDIDWTQLFARTGTPPVTEINVANPDFFKGLQSILASTDLSAIRAYLRWQLIDSTPSWSLPQAMDDEDFTFFGRELRGQPQQRARWKRCSQATDNALGEALGQVYVAHYFPPSSKAATLQMVHDIENAMDRELNTLTWMSPETKQRAQVKLHMIADKIGYPDHWRDYSKLTIVRGDAMGNAFRAAEFENHRQLAKIGKPVDRGEWLMTPATVNAYYDPQMNDINFPAGILQTPLFDPHGTDAEIYGHIGAIVAHELTHGFDDEGRQFDGNGNLSDWWTPQDTQKFKTMTDCEVQEYGKFTVDGDAKVNGELTLGENTADNGGIRLAYEAFLADAHRKGIDMTRKQPDGYTPIQQFFLAFGQNWCGQTRPAELRLQVQTDPHSPDRFRVNGVVQNMPEFGHAFGCAPGQPMMPVNACHVW
ncbi:MAG TPA: M13 family metallopeptidase [Acidobacteriaceae bacterium]|jgi:endothelin-converting enzyme/putative endopeptidase|nr:M13 family metallopeptidase [Acidobacteriaceae bacterium]